VFDLRWFYLCGTRRGAFPTQYRPIYPAVFLIELTLYNINGFFKAALN